MELRLDIYRKWGLRLGLGLLSAAHVYAESIPTFFAPRARYKKLVHRRGPAARDPAEVYSQVDLTGPRRYKSFVYAQLETSYSGLSAQDLSTKGRAEFSTGLNQGLRLGMVNLWSEEFSTEYEVFMNRILFKSASNRFISGQATVLAAVNVSAYYRLFSFLSLGARAGYLNDMFLYAPTISSIAVEPVGTLEGALSARLHAFDEIAWKLYAEVQVGMIPQRAREKQPLVHTGQFYTGRATLRKLLHGWGLNASIYSTRRHYQTKLTSHSRKDLGMSLGVDFHFGSR